jgi:hypothetical protein
LERNCTLKLTRTVFSLVAMLNFYFRLKTKNKNPTYLALFLKSIV